MRDPKHDPDWIKDGERFALLGLNVRVDCALDHLTLPGGKEALPNAAFEVPDHWREWLGTLRVENVDGCSLFLLAKMPAAEPGALDAEDQLLQRRVGDWYIGLMLVAKFFQDDEPFLASGSRENGEIDVLRFQALHPSQRSIVDDYDPISKDELARAASIGACLEAFKAPWQSSHWRLLRCLDIYQATRSYSDVLDRIHQFTRCIEGLIVPKQGETRRQFKSRTELFIGKNHHKLMGELYEVRSHVEHLHENKYLERFDRATRVRLARLEAISEWVARSSLARILLDQNLIAHFGSVDTLERFWDQDEADRRAIWGDPVDPSTPIARFRFDYVSDAGLGARA